jgi:glycosyltransferase involved in cell wall biosynthesis
MLHAPMRGENIISFSKDWSEDPTSNNHVMRVLARDNKVLWLNSISTRTPSVTSARDMKKIVRKLGSFFRGLDEVAPNLYVYTPIVVPLPHNPIAIGINRLILRASIRALRAYLGMGTFQLWSFLPNANEYVGMLGESVSAYYVTDEFSGFTGVNAEGLARADREMCAKVDVVFATATSLLENRQALNPETHLATHGVDQAAFARALDDSTAVHPAIAALPRPIVGFYGLLEDWVDYELIEKLAQRHPEWSIVLVGKAMVDVTRFAKLPNVHLLGRKPHAELPSLCRGFAVGIIPYQLTDRLLHVNPIKLREYLSAGLPVVSAALPEVIRYDKWCTIAHTFDDWERGIAAAIANDTPTARRARSDAMRAETWEAKVAELSATVMRVQHAKRH